MKRYLLALSALCWIVPATYAGAQDGTSFRNKTIKVIIGNAAGGTYDFYGRLTARHLGRFIPDNPSVVPENMPGAGTIRAANYLYSVAPRDGTALGIVAESIAVEQAIRNPAVTYDASKFTWIGRVVSSSGVQIILSSSKVKSLEDAKVHEALLAGTGAGNIAETIPTLMNALLGTKFKIVKGYRSATDALLAMERGEVESTAVNWIGFKASKPDWVAQRKVNVIFQYLPDRDPAIEYASSLGEIGDTEEAKQVFRLYGSMATIGRSILGTPAIPPAQTKVLRDAFAKMAADPEFRKEVENLGTEVSFASGEALEAAVKKTLEIPPAAVERLRSIIEAK